MSTTGKFLKMETETEGVRGVRAEGEEGQGNSVLRLAVLMGCLSPGRRPSREMHCHWGNGMPSSHPGRLTTKD